MTEEERRQWEEQFRREVLEEHNRKNDFLRARADEDAELARQAELVAMRMKVREEFWKSQGYVKYVDSRGGESWVPPDEYELRMERRRQRGTNWREVFYSDTGRNVLIALLVLLCGIAFGVALSFTG